MVFDERRRKVAVVIGQLSYGGAERQVVELALGLQEAGQYVPIVICYTDLLAPFGEILIKLGVRVIYPVQPIHHLWRPIWIRQQLVTNQCDIAYGILNPSNIYTSLACMGTPIKFIASVRGVPDLTGFMRIGLKFSIRNPDAIIANSYSGMQWIIKNFGADPEKVVVIPNAVQAYERNNEKRFVLRESLGISSKDIVIGTIACIKAQKQPLFFLNIANKLIDSYTSPYHFVWVGDGALDHIVKEKLEDFSPYIRSHIHFVGSKMAVEQWLSVFDAFILTSIWEGLSNSLMEAMSIGLPCIVTDVSGNRDIIEDGRTGFLVPVNVDLFMDKLKLLLSDFGFCRKLGENAQKEIISGYGRNLLATKTSQIFDSLLQ